MTRAILLAATGMLSAAIWVAFLPPAPIGQPFPFDHARHTEVTCTACHAGAERAASAGIPSVSICVKCHATAPRAFDQVLTAGPSLAGSATRTPTTWDELARGTDAPWVPATRLPDHVMFSHRRHVSSAGLACVSCHGDMRARRAALTAPLVRVDMNACLSCHKREGATNDCVACHR